MNTLITGGAGFLGSHLAEVLIQKGHNIVLFDIQINTENTSRIKEKAQIVKGDLACFPEVLDAVKTHKVNSIYHCGALLSHSAEEAPLKAYEVNMLGTWYVLEAARLFDVEQVIFTSTVASFGTQASDPTPNIAPQLPQTLYGVSKVSSERLGEYYHLKYGIDFRGVRLPSVIGPGRGPGGTSAYSSLMIEVPILGKDYTVYLEPRCSMPLMYIKDAVKALIGLSEADEGRLRHRIYNVQGFSPTAMEIWEEVEKVSPKGRVHFKPSREQVAIVDSWPNALDDSEARKDWGWKAEYDLERTVRDFVAVINRNKST